MRRYTKEMKEFLNAYVKGHHYSEIREAFNKRFPEDPITTSQIKAYLNNNDLDTGYRGHFEKGMTPHNIGKKQSEWMDEEAIKKSSVTRFKKGQKPVNYRPIGSTRVTRDGFVEIKVADPNKWDLRSRVVYRSVYGEIPRGCVVLHLNGISTDDSPENLKVIKRGELVRLNQQKLFGENLEINKSAVMIAQLSHGISEAKRRKNGR